MSESHAMIMSNVALTPDEIIALVSLLDDYSPHISRALRERELLRSAHQKLARVEVQLGRPVKRCTRCSLPDYSHDGSYPGHDFKEA